MELQPDWADTSSNAPPRLPDRTWRQFKSGPFGGPWRQVPTTSTDEMTPSWSVMGWAATRLTRKWQAKFASGGGRTSRARCLCSTPYPMPEALSAVVLIRRRPLSVGLSELERFGYGSGLGECASIPASVPR